MKLENKRVAILATNGFEKSELFGSLAALKKEGAEVDIISLREGEIKSWDINNWGNSITVNKRVKNSKESDYSALILPGGIMNIDTMRSHGTALNFIRNFVKSGKPVGAICHAPWLLISADVILDREVTSCLSIKDDVLNAGATWIDEEVVVDNGFVTSRSSNDLFAFIFKIIEETREDKHENQVVNA